MGFNSAFKGLTGFLALDIKILQYQNFHTLLTHTFLLLIHFLIKEFPAYTTLRLHATTNFLPSLPSFLPAYLSPNPSISTLNNMN
jgi:hypothetical protein